MDFTNNHLTDQQYKLVYAGCKNEIIISGLPGVEHTYLTSSASSVTQVNDSTFILKPRYRSHMDTLRFYINDEEVQTELFLVMHPPLANVRLGEIETEYTTVKAILKNAYLFLEVGGFYKDYEVLVSFQLKILDVDGNEIKTFDPTLGAELTTAQLDYIKTLKQGQQVQFNDIKVRSAQGMIRKKPVYTLKIE
jgi:hypothetical protein